MKDIEIYKTETGKEPFSEWIKSINKVSAAHIFNYIGRVARSGSKSNIKALGNGIYEIKISKGPGFRVYFGEVENTIILLLIGGDKKTQKQDILKAKEYWRNYNV